MSEFVHADRRIHVDPEELAGRATEAFELLGNETRMEVLLTLWRVSTPPGEEQGPVPFSRIFSGVDYDDPGNLRYHLSKLEGAFVDHAPEQGGYALTGPGRQLVRTIVAGAATGDIEHPPGRIDQQCPFCAAPTEVSYEDGLVVWACTSCGGSLPGETDPGLISATPVPPAGLIDRSPSGIRAASWVSARGQVSTFFDGVCPTCAGPVEATLTCCGDHDPEGVCERCGAVMPAWAQFRCRFCKDHCTSSPKELALFHPAIVGFYDAHGISTRVSADDYAGAKEVFALMDAHDMVVASTEPPRVDVTASCDSEECTVTFDAGVNVVAVDR